MRENEVNRLLRSMVAAVNLSEMVSAYVADASVHAIIGSNFRDMDGHMFLHLLELHLWNMPALRELDLLPVLALGDAC
jgi:hypothetical protein